MAAGVYDFTVEQGVPFVFQVQYQNPDKTGKDLNNWTAVGQVKQKINDCEPLGFLDIEFTQPSEGILTVTVSKEITEDLRIKGTKYTDYGTLVYDIKLWPNNDPEDARRLLNGLIKVSPEVTKV